MDKLHIIDSHLEEYITDQPGSSTYSQYLTLSKTEVDQFLGEQSELITSFENRIYGPVQVYRINWQEQKFVFNYR